MVMAVCRGANGPAGVGPQEKGGGPDGDREGGDGGGGPAEGAGAVRAVLPDVARPRGRRQPGAGHAAGSPVLRGQTRLTWAVLGPSMTLSVSMSVSDWVFLWATKCVVKRQNEANLLQGKAHAQCIVNVCLRLIPRPIAF